MMPPNITPHKGKDVAFERHFVGDPLLKTISSTNKLPYNIA